MMVDERIRTEGDAAVDDERARAETSAAEAGGGVDPRDAVRPGLPSTRGRTLHARPRHDVIAGSIDPAALELAHRVVELASDKKAADIVLLDVRGQTTMTDYFVICSGASDRQLKAIADAIVEGAKAQGDRPLSREGDVSSHWLLIDFGAVIVHVMSAPEREFYQLERLWSEAVKLVHVV